MICHAARIMDKAGFAEQLTKIVRDLDKLSDSGYGARIKLEYLAAISDATRALSAVIAKIRKESG